MNKAFTLIATSFILALMINEKRTTKMLPNFKFSELTTQDLTQIIENTGYKVEDIIYSSYDSNGKFFIGYYDNYNDEYVISTLFVRFNDIDGELEAEYGSAVRTFDNDEEEEFDNYFN